MDSQQHDLVKHVLNAGFPLNAASLIHLFIGEPLEGMSLPSQLDLLFLLRGSWGGLGNFSSTQRAIRHLVAEDDFWKWPEAIQTGVSRSGAVN